MQLSDTQRAALAAHLGRKFTQKILHELKTVNYLPGDKLRVTREVCFEDTPSQGMRLVDTETGETIWPK